MGRRIIALAALLLVVGALTPALPAQAGYSDNPDRESGWVRASKIRGVCDPNAGTCATQEQGGHAHLYEYRPDRSQFYPANVGPTEKRTGNRIDRRPNCVYRGTNAGSAAGTWHRGATWRQQAVDGVVSWRKSGDHWVFAPNDTCIRNVTPNPQPSPTLGPQGGVPTATPRGGTGTGNLRVSVEVMIDGPAPAGGSTTTSGAGTYQPGALVNTSVTRTGSWASAITYQRTLGIGCGSSGEERVSFAMPANDCTVTYQLNFLLDPIPTPEPPRECSNRTPIGQAPGFDPLALAIDHGAGRIADNTGVAVWDSAVSNPPPLSTQVVQLRSDNTVLLTMRYDGLGSRFQPGAGGQFAVTLTLHDLTADSAIMQVDLRTNQDANILGNARILKVTRSTLRSSVASWVGQPAGVPANAFATWNPTQSVWNAFETAPVGNRYLVRTNTTTTQLLFAPAAGHEYALRAQAVAGPCAADAGYWTGLRFRIGAGTTIRGEVRDVTDPGQIVLATAAEQRVQLAIGTGALSTGVQYTSTSTGRFALPITRSAVEALLRSSGEITTPAGEVVPDTTPVRYQLIFQTRTPPYQVANRDASWPDAPGTVDRTPNRIVGTTTLGALFAADRADLTFYVVTRPATVIAADPYLMARPEHPRPGIDTPTFVATRANIDTQTGVPNPLFLLWWYGGNLQWYPTLDITNDVGSCGPVSLENPAAWPGYRVACQITEWRFFGSAPQENAREEYMADTYDDACAYAPTAPVTVRWSKFEGHTEYGADGDYHRANPCADHVRYPYLVGQVTTRRTLEFAIAVDYVVTAPDGTVVWRDTVVLPEETTDGAAAAGGGRYAADVGLMVLQVGGQR